MIEVKIAGIQVSLMSQHRVVLLKELGAERYLPIWIGPYEAEALSIETPAGDGRPPADPRPSPKRH
jgi:bifunctional DNase/RNase